jgi:hypothetical protein
MPAPGKVPPGYERRWLVAQMGPDDFVPLEQWVRDNGDGTTTIRVQRGCGSLYLSTIPSSKVYLTQEAAEERIKELGGGFPPP